MEVREEVNVIKSDEVATFENQNTYKQEPQQESHLEPQQASHPEPQPQIQPEPEPQPDPEIVVEEETIDIDDSTASGRLSALRQEMSSDDGNVSKSVDDISSRLDAFLKDR